MKWLFRRTADRPADAIPQASIEVAAPLHPKLMTNASILATEYGQLATFDSHRPTDANGEPVPWFTYGAIEYLNRFDCRNWHIFEYGCGHSTLYWRRRGAKVTSMEHNRKWFDEMSALELSDVTLLHGEDANSYVSAIKRCDRQFDVIVIDGVWRDLCAQVCLPYLKEDGIVILDNSDWYWDTADRIRRDGFFEFSFSGFGPVNDYTWTTSFFVPGPSARQREFGRPDPIGGHPVGPEARDELW